MVEDDEIAKFLINFTNCPNLTTLDINLTYSKIFPNTLNRFSEELSKMKSIQKFLLNLRGCLQIKSETVSCLEREARKISTLKDFACLWS